MAVNLTKNKDSLSLAWKEVVDEKNKTDWALFGYDGHTFDLKVVGKGDGGLEEMVEDLSSGKIMYAFCRVIDPKTSLPKFVLINWQGEGAPGERKGKCANHIMDISSLLRGAHVTMNARTEDDVDPSIIMDMVAKATGSAYSFKERESPLENHKPVGSVYKRIIPAAEINPAERDKFWEKQENEEKRRIEEERKVAAEERRKLEEERCKRELQDAQRREKMVTERTSSICQQRAAEKAAGGTASETEKKKWERQMQEDANEQQERRNRNESCRQERNEELHALISQRTINARAIFEQNTSVGQMSTINSRYSREVSRDAPPKAAAATNGEQSPPKSNGVSSATSPTSASSPPSYGSPLSPERSPPPSPAPESTPMSYRAPAASDPLTSAYSSATSYSNATSAPYQTRSQQESAAQGHSPEADPDYWDETARVGQALKGHYGQNGTQRAESPQAAQPVHAQGAELASAKLTYIDGQQNFSESQGLMARALYDYEAADETEISFNPDDIITNIDQIDEGWWQGVSPDGTFGLFPANYVELIE